MSKPTETPPTTYPMAKDSEVEVVEGKTMSYGNGWWSAILLVKTFGKVQVKWMLWQEKTNRAGEKEWQKKQNFTINSFNWEAFKKETDLMLEKRKMVK
jgi:hypothetical protein